jgi:hypothetical protein
VGRAHTAHRRAAASPRTEGEREHQDAGRGEPKRGAHGEHRATTVTRSDIPRAKLPKKRPPHPAPAVAARCPRRSDRWGWRDARADPVGFVHRYADPHDREVVALIAALLAFGNVVAIKKSIARILGLARPSPRGPHRHGPARGARVAVLGLRAPGLPRARCGPPPRERGRAPTTTRLAHSRGRCLSGRGLAQRVSLPGDAGPLRGTRCAAPRPPAA